MPIVVGVAIVAAALGVWTAVPSGNQTTPPAAVTVVQNARTLSLSSADINWQATKMAQTLIQSGKVKPAPAKAAASGGPVATPSAPAGGQTTAAPAAAAPEPAHPAPVVHPVKRPPPPAPAPAAAQPAPAVPDPAPATIDPPPAEMAPAIVALVEQAPEETRQDIVSGRQVIYTLHVLDNAAEDGDQVTIMVDGTSYGTVTITNAGQDILIPLVAGTTASVKVIAAFDGGGGVTFGAYSSLGELRSRAMMVGESDDWSVTTQ